MVNNPPHNSVFLHLTKLLDQHLLRDRRNRPFELGKPQHLSTEEMKENDELPSAFEKLERLPYSRSSGHRRISVILTWR